MDNVAINRINKRHDNHYTISTNNNHNDNDNNNNNDKSPH